MKIIVNSGNVGTPVALELAGLGHQVALTVRTPKSNPEWDKLGIRQVPFDINDPASMAGALKEGEVFFSLTPLVENMVEAGTRTSRLFKVRDCPFSRKQAPATRMAKVMRCAKTRNSFRLWHKNGPQTKNKLMDI